MSRVKACSSEANQGTSNFKTPHRLHSSPQSDHQLHNIQYFRERILTIFLFVQCDEQHPKCRNCIKSKRECLGYDPIFKQQQGPTQLQPAPSASPSSSASAPTAGAPPSYPPSSAPYHPVSNGTSVPPVTSSSAKQESSQPYEFGSAIDPALAGGGSGAMASYGGAQFRPPTIGTDAPKN